jgi:signal transduction histidine kinase
MQIWRIAVAIFAVLWCGFVLPQDSLEQQVVNITKATVSQIDLSDPPFEVTLPSLSVRSPRHFKRFRMNADFTVDSLPTDVLWALYFVSLYDGGSVRINGALIGEVETSTAETTVRHARPYMMQIPPKVLRSGINKLQLDWSSRESLTLVSRVLVGPAAVIAPHYESRFFWQNDMAKFSFVYALVVAVILLGIYTLRRHQLSYLLLGLSAIGCAVVFFVYFLPAMPASLYPYWRFVHICGIALFSQCAWLFLIQETQPHNRWFPRFCQFWGALGPFGYLINFWINDNSFFRAFEGFWGMAAGLIGLYPVALLAISVFKKQSWRKLVFLLATILAIIVGVLDMYLQSSGTSKFGNYGYSLQVVSSVWLTALTSVLISDFISSLTQQDAQRRVMEQRLEQQQSELGKMYESTQQIERDKAALEERQRIMQDIHDGLGSQLITSLALSERGGLSRVQTSLLLRECIDDLRLAIDTMSGNDDQFSVAAGNLRFRMEPRLRAAGVTLKWDSSNFADDCVVPAGQTLPLLRIMQEVITNALKHANAQHIFVALRSSVCELVLEMKDDGVGFDYDQVRKGKGLSGIEKRARALGATLSMTSEPGATAISLYLPLQFKP